MKKALLIVFGCGAIYLAMRSRNAESAIYNSGESASIFTDGIESGLEMIKNSAAELIKKFEGFSETPYNDANGQSIGYGHFILPGENFSGVTQDMADQLLQKDMANAQNTVTSSVTVPLTQNQNDALVSLVYNIGVGAFRNSTLLKKLNAGDYQGAADQFLVWVKSLGMVNKALVERRTIERNIFIS